MLVLIGRALGRSRSCRRNRTHTVRIARLRCPACRAWRSAPPQAATVPDADATPDAPGLTNRRSGGSDLRGAMGPATGRDAAVPRAPGAGFQGNDAWAGCDRRNPPNPRASRAGAWPTDQPITSPRSDAGSQPQWQVVMAFTIQPCSGCHNLRRARVQSGGAVPAVQAAFGSDASGSTVWTGRGRSGRFAASRATAGTATTQASARSDAARRARKFEADDTGRCPKMV